MRSILRISAAVRNGRTFLREGYAEAPFRIANISEDKSSSCLHLMLMCSSPGVLDGDNYELRVGVEEGAQLRLHTQSFQRLFSMQEGARQRFELRLGIGSCFVYLPHPVTPHRSSIFTGISQLHLSAGSRLIWGEVITCGRKAHGEVFQFSRYHSVTTVYRDEVMVLRENVLLEPAVRDLRGIGQLEGYTHQASLLMAGLEVVPSVVRELLEGRDGLEYGLSEGPGGIWVLRLLGNGAEQLYASLRGVAGIFSAYQTPFYAG